LSTKADGSGFAVAYPDGRFNSRLGATDWQYLGNDFTDDVTFLRQLIDVVTTEIQADPRRVYVVGFSDGGRLAHRAGVELSDRIAAIGDVAGSLFQGVPSDASVPPAREPVSVLILHGDADAYCGAPLDASQEQTFNYWSGGLADNCSVVDTVMPLCDSRGSITAVLDKAASSCSAGAEVKLYRMIGGGHAWYASLLNIPGQVPFNPDLNMTTGVTTDDVIWNFFAPHTRH
jgi:polyhydroxybutyrate depolymerase